MFDVLLDLPDFFYLSRHTLTTSPSSFSGLFFASRFGELWKKSRWDLNNRQKWNLDSRYMRTNLTESGWSLRKDSCQKTTKDHPQYFVICKCGGAECLMNACELKGVFFFFLLLLCVIWTRDFDLSAHFYFSKEYISLSLWTFVDYSLTWFFQVGKHKQDRTQVRPPFGVMNLDHFANFILESVCL